jgi:uncharacterized membrane protein
MLKLIPQVFAASDPSPALDFKQIINNSNPGGVFVGDPTLGGKADFIKLVGKIAQTSLGVLSVVCITVLVLAGYKYVTAMGNDEQTQKAKTSIQWAIIGLLIAIFSYSIVNVIVNTIPKTPS